MKSRKGFTLVEILIVVVILGILAAIVIPQFSQASTEARESSLSSNLQAIRSQVELHKIQPNDVLPADAATLTTGLTTQTGWDGAAWVDLATSGTAYGPYMKKVPANPFNNLNAIEGATAATAGWVYTADLVTRTYDFVADDGGTSPNGVLHADQ